MEIKELVNKIYENVKSNGSQSFVFKDVFNNLAKEVNLSEEEKDNIIGLVFTNMLEDRRFFFVGDNNWKLAEFLSKDEINKLNSMLYSSVDASNKFGSEESSSNSGVEEEV